MADLRMTLKKFTDNAHLKKKDFLNNITFKTENLADLNSFHQKQHLLY